MEETKDVPLDGGTEEIQITRENDIVTITLNRPEVMNAMTSKMFSDFGRACREINEDISIRAAVITGAGGNFCSGADVGGKRNEALSSSETIPLRNLRRIKESAQALHDIQHPVIAKVRGVAAGAGLNLALGCDLIYASDNARFSEVFARRGLSIDFGGSWLLPRRVGLHRAKELVFLAEMIDATEADRIGLVNRVVSDAELDAYVADIAERAAAGPPLALSLSKALLNNASTSSMSQALEAEGSAQASNFSTEDVREAGLAWMEKRPAKFIGR